MAQQCWTPGILSQLCHRLFDFPLPGILRSHLHFWKLNIITVDLNCQQLVTCTILGSVPEAAGTYGYTVQKPVRACKTWGVPNSWECPMADLSGCCRVVSHACGSPGTSYNVFGVCYTILYIFLLQVVSTGKRLGHGRRKDTGEHAWFSGQRAGEAARRTEDPCFDHAGWKAEADAGSRGEWTAAAGREPAAGGRWAFPTGRKAGRLVGL